MSNQVDVWAECAPAMLADIKGLLVPGKLFRYVEIGLDHCETLIGVCEFLRANHEPDKWLAIGVDVPGWDTTRFSGALKGLGFSGNVSLSDEGSPKIFRHPEWKDGIDFCLIDGCHGYHCVLADFLAVELLIHNGGSVCFHDTCVAAQGKSLQPHCAEGIRVLDVILNTGLMNNTRPNWKCKTVVEAGNGIMIFQKGKCA